MRYCFLLLMFCQSMLGATTNALTQWGITWQFDAEEEYGTFVNGDYWVIAPVTITNMTPAWDGYYHGWEINPTVRWAQGFSTLGKIGGTYTNTLRPELPFTLTTNCSLVKTICGSNAGYSIVLTAAVLTVLTEIPATNAFRPPYVGNDKTMYLVSDLQSNLLPSSYAAVTDTPTLVAVQSNFSKCLRLENQTNVSGWLRPVGSMDWYQPGNTEEVNEAMLRLMLNDSYADKLPALIQFTQHSIDKAYACLYGYRHKDDGESPNHRVVAGWAAILLDIASVKSLLASATNFYEEYVLVNGVDGRALYGEWQGGAAYVEHTYWDYLMDSNSVKSMKDPYGYIDGGEIGPSGASYQNIVSQSLKGQALIYRLFSQMTNCIPNRTLTNLTQYAERWVTNGVWASPDPVAPYDGTNSNYMITFGPDGVGGYIAGAGRFEDHHGANADGGQYKSDFVASMWNAYFTGGATTPRRLNIGHLRAGKVREP